MRWVWTQFIFNKHKRLLMASAALAALAAVALFFLGSGQYLLLTNEQTGAALFCAPARNGSQFAVSFTHSVNKSLVTEYYRIENGVIYLDSLRYYTFGAGMPTEPEEAQTMRFADGAIIIEGFNRPMPYLCYSIGRIAGHALHLREKTIPLNTLDAPGQPVLFSIVACSRLQIMRNRYPTNQAID